MDLSSAIENFSEYFVAANTRTTLTDFAESTSNSMDPSQIVNNGNSSLSNMNSSQNNLSSHLGIAFGLNSCESSPNGNLHKQLTNTTMSQTSSLQNQVPSDDNHYDFDLECNNNNDHYSSTSQPRGHVSKVQQQRERLSMPCDNRSIDQYAHASSSRIPQPARAQIPIHCIIEQFDNYANLTSYQPTLNDNDLFRTEDPTDLSHMLNQNRNDNEAHNNPNTSNTSSLPHLNQSKLALESITNGSPSSMPTPTSNANLFNTPTNPTNSSIFDSNLDHMSPESPLSMQPDQHSSPTFSRAELQPSSILNSPTDIRQDSYLDNNQQLTSSKETYVIVASNVLYIDILPVVLKQLGYSSLEIISAKGKFHTSRRFLVLHLIFFKIHCLFVES